MQIVLIVLILIFLVVLLAIRKKSQNTTQTKHPKTKKSGQSKPVQKEKVTSHTEEVAKVDADSHTAMDVDMAIDLEQLNVSQPVKVSVQEVDPLTEYKVYKEFGYFDKAAEALKAYMSNVQTKDATLILELADMYLVTEQYENLTELLIENRQYLSHEQIETVVKQGLEADVNNLELRVLADELLSWDVETVNSQISQANHQLEAALLQAGHDARHQYEITDLNINAGHGVDVSGMGQSNKLVSGHGTLQNISHEEMQVISVMLPTDNALKLMRGHTSYGTFSYKLDKALPKLKNPAAALIDVLGLDYQNKNLEAFVRHLWELYSVLGKNGQNIKDKMLGWGYSLGSHEVLNKLAMVTTEQEVKEIGKSFGFSGLNVGNNKASGLPLVSDDGIGLGKSLGRNVSSILQEADAYLMYGQLEEAMQTLEQGIKLHKDEPQLYVNLFELYERAEDWARLDDFSKRLRTDAGSLPEEVILVMSQLTQKLKSKNIGMVA